MSRYRYRTSWFKRTKRIWACRLRLRKCYHTTVYKPKPDKKTRCLMCGTRKVPQAQVPGFYRA